MINRSNFIFQFITSLLFCLVFLTATSEAVNYYVAPDGNDGADGLSEDEAWLSIDNGDQLGILVPGDIINILSGQYDPTDVYQLKTNGSNGSPITYRKFGSGIALIDGSSSATLIFEVSGDYVVIEGLEIANGVKEAIQITSDNCIVQSCYIHNVDDFGIKSTGIGNLFFRNIIANTGKAAIEIDEESNLVYHNTVYYPTEHGIHFKGGVTEGRVFNNIVVGASEGIRGKGTVVAGFNDLWLNSSDYTNGISDSSGGIFEDPLFVNPGTPNFNLQGNSPAEDAGLDLGYPYSGDAPDMGAMEFGQIEDNEPPVLTPIGSQTIEEGQSLNFTVIATDPDGTTPLLAAEDLPANADFTDNKDGSGYFTFDPDFSQAGIYTVLFIASDKDFADSESVSITVIDVNRSPVLSPIGSQIVEEGQTLQFTISATDPEGTTPILNAESLPLNATFIDNDDGTGDFEYQPGFSAEGTYNVTFICSDGVLSDSEMVIIVVTADPLNRLVITPDSAQVSADSSLQFTVIGYDGGDNEIDQGQISWELLDPLGSIDSNGFFDAVTVGITRVVAISNLGPSDTSSCLAVVPGYLFNLIISPDSVTISADSTRQFSATGFDTDGNITSILGDLTWIVIGSIGDISNDGLFDAVQIGQGFINVQSDLGPNDITDTITVVAGEPSFIDVTPDANLVVEDSSYQFVAASYDSDSNRVSTITNIADWSTTDSAGSITNTGYYTAGNIPSPPNYYVKAIYQTMNDSSEVTILTSGSLSYIRIEWFDGTPFNNATLTTDNDSTILYCRGYDSGDNLLGNVSVIWSVLGTDAIGDVQSGSRSSTILTLTRIGSGQIAASYSIEHSDMTGNITVQAGQPVRIVIAPDTITISSGEIINFTTSTYDIDNNPTTSIIIDSWFVIGEIGSISNSGQFEAIKTGVGQVVATGSGLTDTTNNITILPGLLSRMIIQPDSAEIELGASLDFEVNGYDSADNEIVLDQVNWSVIGGIGSIDTSGLFTAQGVGIGRVAAQSVSDGITDTTEFVDVILNTLDKLVISPDTATLEISDTITFIAKGFDSNLQPIATGELSWEVVGNIGFIDNTGKFQATLSGVGRIIASSNSQGVSDTSKQIIIELPTITEIPLGNQFLQVGQLFCPILAFNISNVFSLSTGIQAMNLNFDGFGPGSKAVIQLDIESVSLYKDSDENGLLSAADSLIIQQSVVSNLTTLSFAPISIAPFSNQNFFISISTSKQMRDGDSLDLYIVPATDIETSDGITIAGANIINSLGYCITDGMVASQIDLISTGNSLVSAESGVFRALTLDIQRNGYESDVLKMLSIYNSGTANQNDVDSLFLYIDDGNNSWDGRDNELYLGNMGFTGDYWTISGLTTSLTQSKNRFYIAVKLSSFPTNGATFSFGIPIKGIEVNSNNDGPLDSEIPPLDTTTILFSEIVSVSGVPVPIMELIPGKISSPISAFKFLNSIVDTVRIGSINCELFATDPQGASQAELDSQVDSIMLYLDLDGSISTHTISDKYLGSAVVVNGSASISSLDIIIPPNGGEISLFTEVALNSRYSKNNNMINIGLLNETSVNFQVPVALSGFFPIKNEFDFNINSFPGENILVNSVESKTLYGGFDNCLVFDFELPSNGYDDDILSHIELVFTGTRSASNALEAVKLFSDITANGFTEDDYLVGEFLKNESGWSLNGLNHSLLNTLNRFFIAVDVVEGDLGGGNLVPTIPVGGITYVSGTNGPDDITVSNPEPHLILPANRITVISIPSQSEVIYPGSKDNTILTFALYNGYVGQGKKLESIRFSNQSHSSSTSSYSDYELGQVSLYQDNNFNRLLDDDQLLATGYFNDQKLFFSGLNINIPPESLSYFFVVSDLPLDPIDSDSLSIAVLSNSDIGFSDEVNLNGDLPLTNIASLIVNGSIRDQYNLLPITSRTLSPSDTTTTLMIFQPAYNGNLLDTLQSINIINLLDADTTDIETLSLWLDDGNNSFDGSDSLIGELIYNNGTWQLLNMNIQVNSVPPTLIVSGKTAATARANFGFKAAIPLQGCLYSSENDGPIDEILEANGTFLISNSALRAEFVIPVKKYTVGQEIELRLRVTNLLSVTMNEVFAEIVNTDNPDIVELSYLTTGSVNLEPNQTSDFLFRFNALVPGSISWSLRAFSTATFDSSATIQTDPVQIQGLPAHIGVELISSIPTAVTRGQSHVFPLSLRLQHADTASSSATVKLTKLRLRIEDGYGNPQPANSVFSRMVISSGYSNLEIIESITSDSELDIEFSKEALLNPGQQQIISIRVDIDSASTAENFSISIPDAEALIFKDDNADQIIIVDPSVTFPLLTSSCSIDDPSSILAISYEPLLGEFVNYGQEKIEFLKLNLRHPGSFNNSQVQLTEISFRIINNQGNPVIASEIFSEIFLMRGVNLISILGPSELNSSFISIQTDAPPVISPGETAEIIIKANVKSNSEITNLGIEISDSSSFIFRDISSGSQVAATADTLLATGLVFPISSGITHFKSPAEPPEICLESKISTSIIAGTDSVALISLQLDYQVPENRAPIKIQKARVSLIDTTGRPLDPSQLFDRIGYRVSNNQIQYQQFVELDGGKVVFRFSDDNLQLLPAESVTLELIADFEADVPYDHFVLQMNLVDAVEVRDGIESTHELISNVSPGCGSVFPFKSQMTKVHLPAGRPSIKSIPIPTQISFPGQNNVTMYLGELSYQSLSSLGDLELNSWSGQILKHTSDNRIPTSANQIFATVDLYIDNQLIARDSLLTDNNFNCTPENEFLISQGAKQEVVVKCNIRSDAPLGNYLISFTDSNFVNISDYNLFNKVYPILNGETYPLQSAELSIMAGKLEESFVNYPNPFNPARGEFTTIAYVLDKSANIDIELYTITGLLVKRISQDSPKESGSQNTDIWRGKNESGDYVFPGTYLCCITARYSTGEIEKLTRKVVVIR